MHPLFPGAAPFENTQDRFVHELVRALALHSVPSALSYHERFGLNLRPVALQHVKELSPRFVIEFFHILDVRRGVYLETNEPSHCRCVFAGADVQ